MDDLYTMKITVNIEIEKEDPPPATPPQAVLDFLQEQKDKEEAKLKELEEEK